MMISNQTVKTPLVRKLSTIGAARNNHIIVGTHDGCWHPDECLAIAILREAMPEFRFSVIRSRDPFMLRNADIVVDVGHGEFDHHQPDNKHYPNGIPYAACGLVLDAVESDLSVRNMLNYELMFGVSSRDNGYFDPHLGKLCLQSKLDWVGAFYPTWQERADISDTDITERFYEVVNMVQKVYRRIRATCRARVDSDKILPTCPTYLNGKFIELPSGGVPWTAYGYEHKELLGAVYKDDSRQYWVVRVAKDSVDSFCNRVSFPMEWGGLEQDQLVKASGIEGAIFCHNTLFLATFKTRAAANAAMRVLAFIHNNDKKTGADYE